MAAKTKVALSGHLHRETKTRRQRTPAWVMQHLFNGKEDFHKETVVCVGYLRGQPLVQTDKSIPALPPCAINHHESSSPSTTCTRFAWQQMSEIVAVSFQ